VELFDVLGVKICSLNEKIKLGFNLNLSFNKCPGSDDAGALPLAAPVRLSVCE